VNKAHLIEKEVLINNEELEMTEQTLTLQRAYIMNEGSMGKSTKGVLASISAVIFVGIFCLTGFAQESKSLAQAPRQIKKADGRAAQGRNLKGGVSAKDVLNKKIQGIKETPNATSKKDQASDGGSNDPGKRKLQDLDTPNPMDRTKLTGDGSSLGGETGTKGTGVQPIDPRRATALPNDPLDSQRMKTARPPDPFESNKGRVAMPVDPLESTKGKAAMTPDPIDSAKRTSAAQAQKLNAQKKLQGSKAMEAQATEGVK